MQKREFPFAYCLGGKAERRVHIFCFKIRKRAKNVFLRHSLRNHANNGRNGNAKSTNTRHTVHLFWIDSNSVHDRGTDE
jgi:hypothetical protein